jgi:hypothetical protein
MNNNGACGVPTAIQLAAFILPHNGILFLPVTAIWSIYIPNHKMTET